MAEVRRRVDITVDKTSFLNALSGWKKHLGISCLEEAITLALRLLFLYHEAVIRGYTEIFSFDGENKPRGFLSTDEILWEYGEKRFRPCGEVERITFLIPPVYIYSLMPEMIEHLGIENYQSLFLFALALLELYADAEDRGRRIVMLNPKGDDFPDLTASDFIPPQGLVFGVIPKWLPSIN